MTRTLRQVTAASPFSGLLFAGYEDVIPTADASVQHRVDKLDVEAMTVDEAMAGRERTTEDDTVVEVTGTSTPDLGQEIHNRQEGIEAALLVQVAARAIHHPRSELEVIPVISHIVVAPHHTAYDFGAQAL